MKRGYKQTEVGVLPDDWELKPLGAIGRFKNGINKSAEDFGHGYPFVNLLDVFGKSKIRINGDELGLVRSSHEERRAYDLKEGDVLFVRSSVKPDGVGLTTVIKDDLPDAVFSGFLLRFRDNGELVSGYKGHCFFQERFRRFLIARSTVSANTNINQAALKGVFIWFPPNKNEQSAIATALSDVDALLAGLDKLIAKKRDIKHATMQQLLTGKIRLPAFTGAWESVRLGDYLVFIKNAFFSRAELEVDGVVKYLHYGDIHTSTDVYLDPTCVAMPFLSEDRASGVARLRDGDLVFVDATEDLVGVGKSVEVFGLDGGQLVAGLHTIAVRFDKKVLADGFKAYLQFIPDFRRHLCSLAAGTKVLSTNRAHIASAQLALPAVEEQEAIAVILRDMDEELKKLEARRERTRLLKQGMMQELLTGRIRLI